LINVLVVGASGLLGTALSAKLKDFKFSVTRLARGTPADITVDASSRELLFQALDGRTFDAVINLVALTSVETCEDRPDLAHRFNVLPAEHIASWIRIHSPDSHLIQLSTDHVYDGSGPHDEVHTTVVNSYAQTKYASELAAMMVPSTILRTNFVGRSASSRRESLTDWLYDSLNRKEHIQVLDDVLFSPLAISTICSVLVEVIKKRPVGVFNLGSKNGMSKADFDFEFASLLGLPTKFMTRIDSTSAKFLRARRPFDMRMDSTKIEKELSIELPTLREEIRKVAKEYEAR
jgi:dTDP-4-dehydrorhamnose reductase